MRSLVDSRNLGGVIGDIFRIYGRNTVKVLAIVAIVNGTIEILGWVFLRVSFSQGDWGSDLRAMPLEQGIIAAILLVVSIFAGWPLQGGALMQAVSEHGVRNTMDIGRAFGLAWKRLGAMAGATILTFVPCALLSATIIGIPVAVYLLVRWTFIFPAALLEGLGPKASLSRSSELVKGNWWRVMAIMALVYIITLVIHYVFHFIPTLGGIIGTILSMPVMVIGIILLYFDLRVKKEEYNQETLAGEFQIDAPVSAA